MNANQFPFVFESRQIAAYGHFRDAKLAYEVSDGNRAMRNLLYDSFSSLEAWQFHPSTNDHIQPCPLNQRCKILSRCPYFCVSA